MPAAAIIAYQTNDLMVANAPMSHIIDVIPAQTDH
jgi:hypothetical protein